jgi:hypothetical protein
VLSLLLFGLAVLGVTVKHKRPWNALHKPCITSNWIKTFYMTKHVQDNYMDKAREATRAYYKPNEPDAFGADYIINIAVSYDGS